MHLIGVGDDPDYGIAVLIPPLVPPLVRGAYPSPNIAPFIKGGALQGGGI